MNDQMPAAAAAAAGALSLIHEEEINATDHLGVLLESNDGNPLKGNIRHHLSPLWQILITILYGVGILGNLAALGIISRNETSRYRKQALMLRCLALNDLLALVGSFVLMYIHLYLPNKADPKWVCIFRVIWRAFGLGSGCVSFVMALERWLALSHSFRYRKYVTHAVVRRSILGLWTFNALLVCAPFLGFGLWFDETNYTQPCVRYRFGKTPLDRAYAYLIFSFGFSMCLCIVCCNLAVIRVLCRMGEKMITRRYSRASSSRGGSSISQPNHATPDEVSFARLMGFLSIFFVLCWCPQLLSIIAGQITDIPPKHNIYKVADLLIALNFTLDPYIYVVFRHRSSPKQSRYNQIREDQKRSHSSSRSVANGSSHASRKSSRVLAEDHSLSSNKGGTGSTVLSSEREYVPLELLIETPKSEETDKSDPKISGSLYHLSGTADEACRLSSKVDSTSESQCSQNYCA